ncbi:methyltransferase, FxLD system [Haloactinomyces albus]|uniref:methyltransferase, FxLD system n=1 Tax=Haloactinomyces albus TaxID=1352928 RepID=UPI0035B562AE
MTACGDLPDGRSAKQESAFPQGEAHQPALELVGIPGFNRGEDVNSALQQGAGLDWYEKGDVWAKFACHRQPGTQVLSGEQQRRKMYRLLATDPMWLADNGPLSPVRQWVHAYASAGKDLAELAHHGRLDRGLRAVLAHHVLFAWNRLGLPYQDQKTLSELAREVVFTDPMTTDQTTTATSDAGSTDDEARRRRNGLVDQLREQGRISDDRVEQAVRETPRHLFVPNTPLTEAYTNDAVYTKHDDTGAISAASQPGIVTMMLEQLHVTEGRQVLEIGAGTGYNAALLAHLAGPDGHVTTIDVDDDLVTDARTHLANAEVDNVEVILGDGALGHPDGAPYDRVIATVGAAGLPEAWRNQTAHSGRLVVPVRIAGSVARSIAFERCGDHWTSVDSQLCGFMPLRAGVADDPRRILEITEDASVQLYAHCEQDIDARALAGVLDTPAQEVWTGVEFVKAEPLDPVWLWLACALPNSLSRMPVHPNAIDSGLVSPMLGWGSMATVDGSSLAYLTMRVDQGRHEIGAIGHGPAGTSLAETMAHEIATWSQYRSRSLGFAFHSRGTAPEPGPGQHVITRPSGSFTVTWQA